MRTLCAAVVAVALSLLDASGGAARAEPSAEEAIALLAEADGLIQSARKLRLDPKTAIEAELATVRALTIRRTILGPDAPQVAVALDDLGAVHFNRGDYENAIVLYRQAIKIAERTYGPRHLEIANILDRLGGAFREAGRFDEGEPILRRALATRVLLLKRDDPNIGDSHLYLGRLYLKQGLYRLARAELLEAKRIFAKNVLLRLKRLNETSARLKAIDLAEKAPPPGELPFPVPTHGTSLKLDSGIEVDVLAWYPVVVASGWSGTVLALRPSRPLDDAEGLRREVDEVWQKFIVNTVKARHARALIVALDPAGTDRHVDFLFRETPGGWRTSERPRAPDAEPPKMLDEALVRDVVMRVDHLSATRNGFSVALYFANDWEGRLTVDGAPVTLRRDDLVARIAEARTDVTRDRQILAVDLAPGGRSATVRSRTVDIWQDGGVRLRRTTRTTSTLVLVDDHLEFTGSDSDVTIDEPPL